MFWSKPRSRAFAAALLLGLTACPQRTAIWIGQGSDATRLEFLLGRTTGQEGVVRFYTLRVDRCDTTDSGTSAHLWMIGEPSTGQPAYPTRVIYGIRPPGFAELVPPQPLTEGCYVARLGGTGLVQFRVTSTGAVVTQNHNSGSR